MLPVSQVNYTLTSHADHSQQFAHDTINRFLRQEKFTPRLVWDNVRSQVVATVRGYVILDDTVLDKSFSHQLERCQCRKARIQRNHIACAFLVRVRLKELTTETGRTIYQLKHGLLSNYLIQQLKNPSLKLRKS